MSMYYYKRRHKADAEKEVGVVEKPAMPTSEKAEEEVSVKKKTVVSKLKKGV